MGFVKQKGHFCSGTTEEMRVDHGLKVSTRVVSAVREIKLKTLKTIIAIMVGERGSMPVLIVGGRVGGWR